MSDDSALGPFGASGGGQTVTVDACTTTLAVVFRANSCTLRRIALRMTRDSAEADDIVQEAFLRACEHDLTQPPEIAWRWIVTVVRRLAIDHKRKMIVGRKRVTEQPIELAALAPEPEHVAIWSQVSFTDLKPAISALPATTQTIFELWCAGNSYEAIARMQRIPLGTVATRILRAKARLRAVVVASANELEASAGEEGDALLVKLNQPSPSIE